MMANQMVTTPPVNTAAYVIARYLRISHEDESRDESNSITNQRAIIQDFIESAGEFANVQVRDYVDDGISGSHTDREAYQCLMRDVYSGAVDCIIVKDLSRIGRNMLDIDDLLMNELLTLRVRFIAIGNGYDSFRHPLSNLELAIINLANEHYNKDLAVKSLSSRHVKMRKGEFLSCWAIYGYKKSEHEKNQLEIDEEAAAYVRLIFSLARSGNNISEIARILNAQGVPTPSEYKKRLGICGGWKVIDPEYAFWNNALAGRILHDERYTGKAISNMYKVKKPGKKGSLLRPKEEWIIVPDAHPFIVPETDFKAAHDALAKAKTEKVPADHIFLRKVKCPVCGRTMIRSGKYTSRFYCTTGRYTDHYKCPDVKVSQEILEEIVLSSVQVQVDLLVDQEELRLSSVRQTIKNEKMLDDRLREEENAIRLLEASITKNFTSFVSGAMTQDAFIEKKEVINTTIVRKQAEMEQLRKQRADMDEGEEAIQKNIAQYKAMQNIETLDRSLVDQLIDHILVHDEKEIEIVWADMGKSKVPATR